MIPEPAYWPALLVGAVGAILDVKDRRIPNWLCAVLALCAGGGLWAASGMGVLPWAILHAVLALLVGMALFALRMIGGGDAKFYAAAALAVPASPVAGPLSLLGWTSLTGLLVLIVMLMVRPLRKRPPEGGLLKGWSVPYGVAIAGGFWMTVLIR